MEEIKDDEEETKVLEDKISKIFDEMEKEE